MCNGICRSYAAISLRICSDSDGPRLRGMPARSRPAGLGSAGGPGAIAARSVSACLGARGAGPSLRVAPTHSGARATAPCCGDGGNGDDGNLPRRPGRIADGAARPKARAGGRDARRGGALGRPLAPQGWGGRGCGPCAAGRPGEGCKWGEGLGGGGGGVTAPGPPARGSGPPPARKPSPAQAGCVLRPRANRSLLGSRADSEKTRMWLGPGSWSPART